MKMLHPFEFRSEFIFEKSVIHFQDGFFCVPSYKLYARLNPERRWTHFSEKSDGKLEKNEKTRKIVFLSFENLFYYDNVLRDR